ncbi:RNA helicase [Malassezia cuniculi]|uniref:RNA helicase n=1 Tax=Malassezia cuniculi TaxID=948313 RepID=A0AAF0J5R3_9BASI|nr:RNA helicase [Malassezia cuniculi]
MTRRASEALDDLQELSKRARLAGDDGESPEEDHEQQEEREVEQDEQDEQEVEQDELEDTSLEEHEAHSASSAPSTARSVSDSVSGTIARVDMINFMCHRNLSIPLGPHINFIIGHNGSGKSAILTALTVALGGRASATSRGSSVKSFVRQGASVAEVRVHLNNTGTDAFRHEIYGDMITVERRINADGGGHWRIRNADGKTVSTKREDLDALCDHCNIQVDNPMNILTQDAARQFLGSSQPEDKYSFFLRGTQLSQLAHEYELIQSNIQRMRRALARSQDVLPELEQAAREANAKWQLIEQARAEQEKLDSLKDELVWSQVIAKEKELAAVAETLARSQTKLEALERKKAADAERATALDEEITTLEQRSRECGDREKALEERRLAATEAARAHKVAYTAARAQEKEISQVADRIQRTIDELQEQIDAESRTLAEDRRARRAAQEAQRDTLVQERIDAEMNVVTHTNAASEARNELDRIVQEQKSAASNSAAAADKALHLEHMIARFRDVARNRITAYGPTMPHVLEAIRHERRWKDAPVGPIGLHIRLRDMRWAPLVEAVLGDVLNAFCVTNHADRELLTAILRKHQCKSQVYTSPADLFDFSHGEPEESVLTLLRALDIDDPYIVRSLVNSVNAERSALVDARVQGDMLIRRGIPNVHQVYSADLFKITGGPTGSSTQTVNKYNGPPRFTASTAAQIQEAESALAACVEERNKLDAQMRTLTANERAQKERIRELDAAAAESRAVERRTRHALAQLEDEMRDGEPANVGALEAARSDAQEEMDRIVEQFKRVEAEKEAAAEQLRPHNEALELIREQAQVLAGERSEVQQRLEALFVERVRLSRNETHWDSQIESQKQAAADAESSEGALARQLEEWTRQALEYCPRVETQRDASTIERQISLLEAQLQEAGRRSGVNLDTVVRELREKNKAFQDAKKLVDATSNTVQVLERAINVRLEKWHYFRRYVAIRARANFALHLQNRGFSGSLHFDHNAQRLRLRVSTGEPGAHDKDPLSLSGGEKSFATVCLLLALWEAVGCPIRCLDEFDVFMDAVNRKVSMRMIIDAARASAGVQYILITPQNMSAAALGPDVRVHRMHDPER